MKLVVPINSLELIPFYASLWIKEVYGGFIDTKIWEIDDSKWLLNGRPSENANFKDIHEMQLAIDECRKVWIKFHVVFNMLPYLEDDALIKMAVDNIRNLDFDSIILWDINLLEYFSDKEVVISTLSTVYNSYHIELLLEKYNITKIVLPRELSVKEQKSIIQKFPHINFEILVFNDWCYNNDGTCSSVHFHNLPEWVEHTCKRDKLFYNEKNPEMTKKLVSLSSNKSDCKSCMMYFFKDEWITFKIAGRSKNIFALKKDILYIVHAYKKLTEMKDYNSFNAFNMALYKKVYVKECGAKNCEMYNFYRK